VGQGSEGGGDAERVGNPPLRQCQQLRRRQRGAQCLRRAVAGNQLLLLGRALDRARYPLAGLIAGDDGREQRPAVAGEPLCHAKRDRQHGRAGVAGKAGVVEIERVHQRGVGEYRLRQARAVRAADDGAVAGRQFARYVADDGAVGRGAARQRAAEAVQHEQFDLCQRRRRQSSLLDLPG
jgi:hypothetical protein